MTLEELGLRARHIKIVGRRIHWHMELIEDVFDITTVDELIKIPKWEKEYLRLPYAGDASLRVLKKMMI